MVWILRRHYWACLVFRHSSLRRIYGIAEAAAAKSVASLVAWLCALIRWKRYSEPQAINEPSSCVKRWDSLMLAVASNREQPNTLYSGIKGVRGRIVKFYESDTLSARSGVILPLRHVFSVGILFSIRVTCLASKRSIGTLHSEIRINENVRGPSNNRHKFFFKFFYKPHFLCITFRGTKLTIQFFLHKSFDKLFIFANFATEFLS